MTLTDTAIRTAKPTAKPRRLYDERGLYVEVSPSGGKLFRFKYRFAGKEKRLALGGYPDVSLSRARERRDEARCLLADGVDPGEAKKVEKVFLFAKDQAALRDSFNRWLALYRGPPQ